MERGVGDGRLGAAALVAGGARHGARASRSHAQEPAHVDVGDRSAARADRPHVRPGALQGKALHLALEEQREPGVLDQGGVEAGAAHVGDDGRADAEGPGDAGGGRRPRDRPGQDGLERPRGGLGQGERPAARAGDEQPPREPPAVQLAVEVVQVGAHPPPYERVDHGGGGALVLAVLPRHLVRQRHLSGEPGLAQQVAGPQLVRRVGVGVDQHDGDGVHSLGAEDLGGGQDIGGREVAHRRPVVGDPLPRLPAEPARHQGRRRGPEQVVRIVPVAPPDLKDVPEPLGGDQADRRPAPLQQRVEPDGGAVDEVGAALEQTGACRRVDGGQHPDLGGLRRRRPLGHRDLTGLGVVRDQVGERAADVDPYDCGHVTEGRAVSGRCRCVLTTFPHRLLSPRHTPVTRGLDGVPVMGPPRSRRGRRAGGRSASRCPTGRGPGPERCGARGGRRRSGAG